MRSVSGKNFRGRVFGAVQRRCDKTETEVVVGSDNDSLVADPEGARVRRARKVERRELAAAVHKAVEHAITVVIEADDVAAIVDGGRACAARTGELEDRRLAVGENEPVLDTA